jgi:hypothetical protein
MSTPETVFPIPPDDDRPWDRPGAVRRDSVPHRSHLVQTFGTVGLVSGFLALPGCVCSCLLPFSLTALGFGTTAWVMGRSDLRSMDAGVMDPSGRSATRLGKNFGMAGVFLGITDLLATGLFWGAIFLYQEVARRGALP